MNGIFWGLNNRTPNRDSLKKNDKVVFSLGARKFLGTAILDSDSFQLTEEQQTEFSHSNDFFRTDFGIRLKDTELWEEPKPIEQYVQVLSFIKEKEQYPVYFQGGIKKISIHYLQEIISYNAKRMIEDAVNVALQKGNTIKWDDYDLQKRGIIDALYVVHSGPGAEAQSTTEGRAKNIWSHKWVVQNPVKVTNKTTVAPYLTVPEDGYLGVNDNFFKLSLLI